MPTLRPRHAITETPPVQAALDRLRQRQGSDHVDMAELVILGAEQKLARLTQLEEDEKERFRQKLADEIRSGALPQSDLTAADEVRRRGWIRS